MRADTLAIATEEKEAVLDITDQVAAWARAHAPEAGALLLYAAHTTVGLTVADLDPGTDLDLLEAWRAMVPRLRYRHPHDPSHVGDHILSALMGVSLTVPLSRGAPVLGTWQRIVLVEFDGPRTRTVHLRAW